MPRVGEAESETTRRAANGMYGKRFRHRSETAPKPLDRMNKDYERKVKKMKKKQSEKSRVGEEERRTTQLSGRPGKNGAKGRSKPSRYGGKPIGRVKSELKTVDQIRKTRELQERKRAKNARPSKKGKGRR